MTAPLINAVDAYQTRPMSELIISNSLAGLAARIHQQHDAASSALKSAISHAIAAGELLLQAKRASSSTANGCPGCRPIAKFPERTVTGVHSAGTVPPSATPLRICLCGRRSRPFVAGSGSFRMLGSETQRQGEPRLSRLRPMVRFSPGQPRGNTWTVNRRRLRQVRHLRLRNTPTNVSSSSTNISGSYRMAWTERRSAVVSARCSTAITCSAHPATMMMGALASMTTLR